MTPELLAAVRQQMCNMVDAANFVAGFNLPSSMSMIQTNQQQQQVANANSVQQQQSKIISPAMNSLAKNGGEPSNVLQMPRLGSPAMHHSLPNEMSMKQQMRKEHDDDEDDHHKALNSRLSITKLSSPKNLTSKMSPMVDLLEPAVNLAISGQSLDMSFKSSRASSDGGSINGEDRMYRNSSGYKDSSPIKMEPMAECRD